MISKEVKMQCIELKDKGMKVREIYEDYFLENTDSEMTYDSFRRKLNHWKKRGVYEEGRIRNFTPRWGTVQYDGNGNIITEYIRGDDGRDWHQEILKAIEKARPLEKKLQHYHSIRTDRMLEIPLFDMHLGVADFNHYRQTQNEIAELIERGYDEIIFAVGSDLFHNNDHRGRTAKGTQIEQVDMLKAFDDAVSFYVPLINLAREKAKRVRIIYVKGNHDETPSWYFVKYLSAIYQDVVFDLEFQEKKIVTWKNIFIGYTHGDKGQKAIPEVFITKWATEWSKATTREIHTGHLHVLKERDSYGTRVRTLPTAGITDQWSKDGGFEGAVKEFNIFEYKARRLCSVHSVYAGEE